MATLLVALVLPAAGGGTGAGAATTTTTTIVRKPTTTTTSTTSLESARQQAIDGQIKTLREQVEEASDREGAVLDRLDEVAAGKRSLDGQVAALDADIAAAEAELTAASEHFGTVTADLQRAEAKFDATDGDLTGARTDLTERAVRAYVHQPTAQLASLLLERQSFRELAAARDFLSSVVDAQARSVERYRRLRGDIDAERQSLATLQADMSAQRDVVALHRDELLRVRGRQDELRAKASVEQGRQQALLRDVRSRVKEFEGEIAALKKESDNIASLLRTRQAAQQKAAPSGKGALATPVAGAVTSTFGARLHPIFQTMRMHAGTDFAASVGTPVKAAADGVVVAAGTRSGYGETVILDHGNNLATLYGHLSRVGIADGAKVTRGQVIGFSGSSGYSTGPHLHFEVRVSGNPVDPLRYL